jgi:hypothetical protein
MPAISNFVVLLSAAATALGTVHHVRASHGLLARRMEAENIVGRSENETSLSKRFTSPRVTWYPTNTGADACTGRNHGDYDNIVALNIPQWGNMNSRSSHCGKKIRIHANGKSEIGVIQDCCATCYNWGEIDLTKGLFQKFHNLDKGEFLATWEFVDGGDDDDDDPPPPPVKKPVKKPTPKPPKNDDDKDDDDKDKPSKPKPKPTPPPKKHSSKSSSSTKKSSSTSSSSTPVLPVPTPPTPPTPPTEDTNVGNAGADPSADSSLSGGISSGLGNGAAGVTFNKFVAGAAALILAFHAL